MESEAMLKLVAVNKTNFEDVPEACRRCMYWQTTEEFTAKSMTEKVEKERLKWFQQKEKDYGCSGGFIAYHNNKPIGFGQCAPAKYFPNIKEYQSGPPSEDAVFLACLYISNQEMRNKGYGTQTLKGILAELKQRGYKAVETFARKSSPENPSGPLTLYMKNGFRIIRDDADFPLVRLELK
jgi:GNAT superfamily N-acetyltransferase